MRYCPECDKKRKEKFCPVCGKKTCPEEEVFLYSAANAVEGDMLMDILRQEGINAFYREKEMGGYLSTYMGYSMYGVDIFVSADDLKKAREIVGAYFEGETEIAETSGEAPGEKSETQAADLNDSQKTRRRAGALTLVLLWGVIAVAAAALCVWIATLAGR